MATGLKAGTKANSTGGTLASKLKKAATTAAKTAAPYQPRAPIGAKLAAVKPLVQAKSTQSSSGSGGGGSYGNRGGYSYSTPSYSSSRVNTGYRSGGVGGSAAGSGGVQGPVAWNPTGLASNYLQTAADMFARDPTILLQDLTTQKYGAEGQNQIAAQLTPQIRNANALFLASQGQDGIQGTDAEWINWLGDYINQQLTPGQFFNSTDAMKNVLGAVEGSPLRAYLTTGDAIEQTGNTQKIMSAILDTGYHPLMAEAMSKQIEEDARNYAVAATKAAQDPFVTYLKAQNPNLTRLLGV